jgi:hypothetical protein
MFEITLKSAFFMSLCTFTVFLAILELPKVTLQYYTFYHLKYVIIAAARQLRLWLIVLS